MIGQIIRRLLHPTAHDIRHYGGFVLAGTLAFAVDVSVLHVLDEIMGISPLLARPFSIMTAMVVSWYINRTITFAMESRPSISEFLQFAAVVWFAQAVNYLIFAAIMLARPDTPNPLAVALASLVSMCVSYMGYRFGVFRTSGKGAKK
jgi:putative flippase GtrA